MLYTVVSIQIEWNQFELTIWLLSHDPWKELSAILPISLHRSIRNKIWDKIYENITFKFIKSFVCNLELEKLPKFVNFSRAAYKLVAYKKCLYNKL